MKEAAEEVRLSLKKYWIQIGKYYKEGRCKTNENNIVFLIDKDSPLLQQYAPLLINALVQKKRQTMKMDSTSFDNELLLFHQLNRVKEEINLLVVKYYEITNYCGAIKFYFYNSLNLKTSNKI